MAFAPFVIGQRLTAAGLNAAVGAVWTSYAPTWVTSGAGADPAISNGSLSGRYRMVGNTAQVRISLIWGSLTSGGVGDWEFGYPVGVVPAATGFRKIGRAFRLDAGNAYFSDQSTIEAGITYIRCMGHASGSYYNATAPVAWAVNDNLEIEIDYEMA